MDDPGVFVLRGGGSWEKLGIMFRIPTMPFRAIASAASKKPTKTPPPDETGMESMYLKALGERQTQVTVKLLSGETFHGWIEYYDVAMIRLTRDNGPNLFIFKHEIMFISEDVARRPRP
jgi:host factor-I protein